MHATDVSDVELLDRVRSGCPDSFGVLWARHWQPVLSTARRYQGLADPEDLVQEAFVRVHQSLLRGGGPFHSFRPYLYRTVRNLAVSSGRTVSAAPAGSMTDVSMLDELGNGASHDPTEEILDRSITVEAFNQLPPRWQEVLWYTVVEGLKPRQVAPLLELTPNAVSALVVRAREGLRLEWLRAHTRSAQTPAQCRTVVERLPEHVRGTLSQRQRAELDEHLDDCTRCAGINGELGELCRSLSTLLPLLLLAPAANGLRLFDDVLPELDMLPGPEVPAGSEAAASGAARSAAPDGASPGVARRDLASRAQGSARQGALRGWPAVAKVAGVVSGMAIAVLGARVAWPDGNEVSPPGTESAESPPAHEGAEALAAADPQADGLEEVAPQASDAPASALPEVPLRAGAGPSPGGQAATEAGSDAAVATGADVSSPPGAPGPVTDGKPDETGEDATTIPQGDEGEVLAPLVIAGPPPGSYALVPEITGTGEPGGKVTLLDADGEFLGITTVSPDGNWAITPVGLEVGTVRIVAVCDDAVSAVIGPYEFQAPELTLPVPAAEFIARDVAPDGSPAARVIGHIRGTQGMAARVELDDDRISAWHQFGLRGFDVHFSNVPVGEHVLTARYVDPSTGRIGAARTVAFTVAGPTH